MTHTAAHGTKNRETTGLILGTLAVAGFSATLPATRVAVEHLDPTLVGLGRSVIAGVLALVLLLATRQALPGPAQIRGLFIVAAGVVAGFPLLSAWAMQQLPAAHAGVMAGILPLLTAVASALRTRERPSTGFWLASAAGSATVLMYAFFSSGGGLQRPDMLLLAAAAAGAVGYAEGGRLAREIGGWQAICWALVLAAPFLALPAGIAVWQHGLSAPRASWLGFGYVTLVSQLLGFFLWYHALALGGVARVSQVQLVQPFLTLVVCALVLGEKVTPLMLGTAVLVVALVAVGRRMPIAQAAARP